MNEEVVRMLKQIHDLCIGGIPRDDEKILKLISMIDCYARTALKEIGEAV